MTDPSMRCGECGQVVSPPHAFHPYFFCRMYREMGISNQEHYLREHGFIRDMSVTGMRETTPRIPNLPDEERTRPLVENEA